MEEKRAYKPRIADDLLRNQLEASGAVLIQGPKWCGKTTTAAQMARSALYMDDPSRLHANLSIAETNPSVLLRGAAPRLIDEWQLAPNLWDAARFEVSRRGLPGQFIYTGSAVPPDKSKLLHTGTGRFAWLTMRPMTLWESGESSGSISLSELFADKALPGQAANASLEEMAYLLCRGGWPGVLGYSQRAALRQAANYVDAVCESDISRVDNVSRNAGFAHRLLRSYARHQGGQVPISTIARDLAANEETGMSADTISSYINALKNIFVIEDMPAWSPNLRSKTAIRTSDTRYFIDPSIATAALGIGMEELMMDLRTFGFLFETMAVRDLRVYADALDGRVSHYRDRNGLECDAVVHLRNGRYGLMEIKLGGDTLIEEGVKNLKKLATMIDTDFMQAPAFLAVLTAVGEYAFQRKDGVWVLPLSALRP